MPRSYYIGIDLAWGDRRPDGICVLEQARDQVILREVGLSRGDECLVEKLTGLREQGACIVAMDAPVICQNLTGARPVDREASREFARFKCGCYPTNLTHHPRPPRIALALSQVGFQLQTQGKHILFEVYPHPAMVRWFGLTERIPYKKGTVAQRRRHFGVLQKHLRQCLKIYFPELIVSRSLAALLQTDWHKDIEDQTDAVVCALVAWWHHRYQGSCSQILGDETSGLMVIPQLESSKEDHSRSASAAAMPER